MMPHNRWKLILAVMWVVTVTGCMSASPTVSYYTLSALQDPSANPKSDLVTVIGIGPIELPSYLDRLPIVTRPNPNRLRVNDYQRWAGPLQADIARVLGENLKVLTGSPRIVLFPWSISKRPDIAVSLTIHAFEGLADDRVVLQATATLRNLRSEAEPETWDFETEQSAVITDYEALVAAQSRALGELSKVISQKIGAIKP